MPRIPEAQRLPVGGVPTGATGPSPLGVGVGTRQLAAGLERLGQSLGAITESKLKQQNQIESVRIKAELAKDFADLADEMANHPEPGKVDDDYEAAASKIIQERMGTATRKVVAQSVEVHGLGLQGSYRGGVRATATQRLNEFSMAGAASALDQYADAFGRTDDPVARQQHTQDGIDAIEAFDDSVISPLQKQIMRDKFLVLSEQRLATRLLDEAPDVLSEMIEGGEFDHLPDKQLKQFDDAADRVIGGRIYKGLVEGIGTMERTKDYSNLDAIEAGINELREEYPEVISGSAAGNLINRMKAQHAQDSADLGSMARTAARMAGVMVPCPVGDKACKDDAQVFHDNVLGPIRPHLTPIDFATAVGNSARHSGAMAPSYVKELEGRIEDISDPESVLGAALELYVVGSMHPVVERQFDKRNVSIAEGIKTRIDRGMDAMEAAKIAIAQAYPEDKNTMLDREERYRATLSDELLKNRDTVDDLGGGFLGIGVTPTSDGMHADFNGHYKDGFLLKGTASEARDYALLRLSNTWLESSDGFEKRPPELDFHVPNVPDRWIREQLAEDFGISQERAEAMVLSIDVASARSGGHPKYHAYEVEDGQYLPFLIGGLNAKFAPDYASSPDARRRSEAAEEAANPTALKETAGPRAKQPPEQEGESGRVGQALGLVGMMQGASGGSPNAAPAEPASDTPQLKDMASEDPWARALVHLASQVRSLAIPSTFANQRMRNRDKLDAYNATQRAAKAEQALSEDVDSPLPGFGRDVSALDFSRENGVAPSAFADLVVGAGNNVTGNL